MSEEFPLKEEFELSPVDRGSLIWGLKRRYANNKQVIALWREYGSIAKTLRRDYRGREDETLPGMVANWITASSLAQTALDSLLDEQVYIESQLAALSGQLTFTGDES
jgi:hypothetical protein